MATIRAKVATRGLQAETEPHSTQQVPDYSPVLGGPLFQLFHRARLAGDGLELLYRRIAALTVIAWLPLLVLSTLSPSASRLSFFRDVEVHVRFLVALPILIAAELIVHLRIRPVVRRFVDRRLVLPEELPRFNQAINSATTLRNSIALEVGLLVFVYTVGLWIWQVRVQPDPSTWYHAPGGPGI